MPGPFAPPLVKLSAIAACVAFLSIATGTAFGEDKDADDPHSRAVLKKLEEKVSLQFPNEIPLEDVINYVRSATQGPNDSGIPYAFDEAAMKRAGKSRHSRVSFESTGEPLKTSLKKLLEPMGLTYRVKKGVLTITADEKPKKSR